MATSDELAARRAPRRGPSTSRAAGRANSLYGDGALAGASPDVDRPDSFSYDPANPVLSHGGNVCCTGNAIQAGAFDQRRTGGPAPTCSSTRSEPFAEATELSGPIVPTLYVSSDARDTDFTVKVLDVAPDGRAWNLDESIQRMRYRNGYDKPLAWMEQGQVYEVTLQPLTTSNTFEAGPPAADRGLEQQLPALRPQPQHRRQQLRRGGGQGGAQQRAPLEEVPSRVRSRSWSRRASQTDRQR